MFDGSLEEMKNGQLNNARVREVSLQRDARRDNGHFVGRTTLSTLGRPFARRPKTPTPRAYRIMPFIIILKI